MLRPMMQRHSITDIILKLGGQTTEEIDKGPVEYLRPYGLETGLTGGSV
jgi:hypothetical protein